LERSYDGHKQCSLSKRITSSMCSEIQWQARAYKDEFDI